MIILVGTKSDLENNREISQKDAEEFCLKNGIIKYIETSAKSNKNIDFLLQEIKRNCVI